MVKVKVMAGLTVAVSVLLLQSCASTDELFAQYDAEFCAVDTHGNLGTGFVPTSYLSTDMDWKPVVFFAHDSSVLTDEEKKKLEINARLIEQLKGYKISMKGFADRPGTEEYNLALAGRRVEAVKTFLTETLDIDATTILGKAIGEENIDGSSHSKPDNRARRVEMLLFAPKSSPVDRAAVADWRASSVGKPDSKEILANLPGE